MSGAKGLEDIVRAETGGLLDQAPESTYELIRRSAQQHADQPALSFFLSVDTHRTPERWTYAELLRDITRTANMFARMGAGKDTVIAYILPNLPETHFVIWGGEASGIVLAINPLLEGPSIAELLKVAGAEILVTLAPFPGTDLWQKVQPILADVPSLRHLVLVNLADHIPGMKGSDAGPVPPHIALHDFKAAMLAEDGDTLNVAYAKSSADKSSFFCTGGTTGAPKIAMRRHGNEVANALMNAYVLGQSMAPGKVIFCGLPLFHVNGAMVTGLVPFSQGAHVILGTPQGYRGKDVVRRFWEMVSVHRINFFSGVPTLYSSLLDVPIGENDISSLEFGLCGAAPMPVEVFRSFQERTGLRILEGYGLTEGTCVSSVNPPAGDRRLGSIGIRLPGQKMKAVVLDDAGRYMRDCAPDEAGLIVISGPNVFDGYLQPEHNTGLWVDLGDGETWLNTGDIGRADADGYFWLTGRKKDIIIRGGHNIDPSVIEEALHGHPDVHLAAAIGRPDVYAGEVPVAYVQLKDGSVRDEASLLAFAQTAISERAAIPKHIAIIDAMPLTGVGKIFKPELRRLEIGSAIRDELSLADIKASIEVDDSPARGTEIVIHLKDPSRRADTESLVGRFPFPFAIR
ncbi:acyl-CoA synthetase [Rhizobium sp. C4]|uniref:acyl-CoA synthetase n=1 Tax=Rhizobium sp. C4 TaxID=1349800 RepID=UPI001E530958|nr:acyl-CoA synthetase [Rhizobium sp. C4]MCD2175510.1 acyl-CoA synthetase [Rhizobium sp. C4]